jgi:hypothetical protein
MKKNIINLFGRLIHSKKIKEYESKIKSIYLEDWSNGKWEDYALDCIKTITEIKELVNNNTGTKRMEYLIGLQAYYNVCETEINCINNLIELNPKSELKNIFKNDYTIILNEIDNMELSKIIQMGTEQAGISNSTFFKQNFQWKYILSCLLLSAIDEKFGEQLNIIETNIRK